MNLKKKNQKKSKRTQQHSLHSSLFILLTGFTVDCIVEEGKCRCCKHDCGKGGQEQCPQQGADRDGMWEDKENKELKLSLWTNKVSRFRWDEKKSWFTDVVLTEKVHRWKEESHQACEKDEQR
jgi:hypothetical protein